MSHIKQVQWGSIFLLIVHVTRWTMELCSVIHFLWLKPWRAIFIKFFFLCFKLVLFFPHLCICQNSEWLKICWLGFSTPKRQLAARFLMFFPKMRNRRAEKTISSLEISHAAFSLPCIHEKLADCLSCCFSLLSMLAVTKFMNSIIAVDPWLCC